MQGAPCVPSQTLYYSAFSSVQENLFTIQKLEEGQYCKCKCINVSMYQGNLLTIQNLYIIGDSSKL